MDLSTTGHDFLNLSFHSTYVFNDCPVIPPPSLNFKPFLQELFHQLSDRMARSFHWYYHGNTPLHYSVLFDEYGDIKKQASDKQFINVKNCYGETALMLASKVRELRHVQLLVESGAALDDQDDAGMNALHHAAKQAKSINVARYLIAQGVNPAALDGKGNSGMHLSAISGNFEWLHLFHSHNVPLDDYNFVGQTPLMLAALHKQIDNVFFFIHEGADMSKRQDSFCKSAFEYALEGKSDQVIDFFIKKGLKKVTKIEELPKEKNATTRLFEKIVRHIENVKFEHLYDTKGRFEKTVVHLDGTSYALLDIFKDVQWELIHFDEQDYKKLFKDCNSLTDDFEQEMENRARLEKPEEREAFKASLRHKYRNLNALDKSLIYSYSGMLSRKINTVLAGCKPSDANLSQLIPRIGFLANALNKMEPEQTTQFVCRGQADIYKENRHRAPLFVSLSTSSKVCEEYVRYGDIVNMEGHGRGHKVFFREAVGYDISGLSSVHAAKELVTLPSLISYSDECFTPSPNSGVIPYYFGTLHTSSEVAKARL